MWCTGGCNNVHKKDFLRLEELRMCITFMPDGGR